ncbi:hypothetical protein ABE501_14320 [Comamonas testosteroni]
MALLIANNPVLTNMMNMVKIISKLLFFPMAFFIASSSLAWAAPVEVYRGVLGSADVVMELGESQADGTRKGRYFYLRHGADIPLRGRLDQLAEAQPLTGELLEKRLHATTQDEPLFEDAARRQVIWHARLQGDALTGEWEDGIRGSRLPFSLGRVAQYDPEKLAPRGVEAVTLAIAQGAGSGIAEGIAISMQATPYDYLRVARPLEQGEEVVVASNLAWRLVRDARTRFWYPRLTRHPDARMLAVANALLEQRHWTMSLQALACKAAIYKSLDPEAGSLGYFDHEQIKLSYLSTTLMSVTESGSPSCGGAHPNNHFDPFTLDLLHGGYLDFSRLIKGYSHGSEGRDYSPQLVRFIRKAVTSRREPRDDDDCTDMLPDFMALMFEAPGKLGFVVSRIGHARSVCLGRGVSLSFGKLKSILKPEATRYLFPLDR